MATLAALPVGQGDAFLLQRADGKTVLVDGGRARRRLVDQVALVTQRLDVVVCTHADADHAEGLLGLLESSRVPVREVWLPGRWASRLVDLCLNPRQFVTEVTSDILAAHRNGGLEQLADEAAYARAGPELDGREGAPKPVSIETLDSALRGTWSQRDALSTATVPPCILDSDNAWHFRPGMRFSKRRLWINAVQTAARILKVARAAAQHGSRIRWFDFDKTKNGATPRGGEPFLRPLNSVELTTHTPRSLGALLFLALSVANRESLVFLAPETKTDSGVVFAADSDLAFHANCGIPPTSRTLAVTAPHHGSEANFHAYTAVACAAKCVVWVRSDGKYWSRPGQSFLGQKLRFCTICRNGVAPKQRIRLDDTSSGWAPALGVRACRCV